MLATSDKTMLGIIVISVSFVWWQSLPPNWLLCLLLFITLALILFYRIYALIGGLVAVMYLSMHGSGYLNPPIQAEHWGQALLIEGYVDSIHLSEKSLDGRIIIPQSQSFVVKASKLGKTDIKGEAKLRLNWMFGKFKVEQGQIIRLLVTLKKPSGLSNPYTFNYEKWLASEYIVATGYVKKSPSNALLINNISLRQQLANTLMGFDLAFTRELIALSIGHRSGFPDDSQTLIQRTGTAHLFAISGMHLSVIVLLSLWVLKPMVACLMLLVNTCNSKLVECNYRLCNIHLNEAQTCVPSFQANVKHVCAGLSLVVALFYAYLSGFNLPVVRACVAVSLLFFVSALGLNWRSRSMIVPLLFIFFMLMPFSSLTTSFWFSFGAVACIYLIIWFINVTKTGVSKTSVGQLVYLQLLLSVFTLPLMVYHFNLVSFVSPIANLIAVPIVSLLLVPACLVALCLLLLNLDGWAFYVLSLCEYILFYLFEVLRYLVDVPFSAVSTPSLTLSTVVLFVVTMLLLIMPTWPYKRTLLVVIFVSFTSHFMPHKPTLMTINVFDVGHGLAIAINDADTQLIYDTGAAYNTGFSIANSVISPFIKHRADGDIEHLFISHSDNDHAGGLNDLLNNHAVDKVHTSATSCNALVSSKYLIQDLNYSVNVLWPKQKIQNAKNNDSCVIKLHHHPSNTSILFSGDIELKAEKALVAAHHQGAINLSSTILLAPHHGSKTSSSTEFVSAVQPDIVIFSAQFKGRWNHPSPSVVARYADIGAQIYNTGEHGSIEIRLDEKIRVTRYRQDHNNYWYMRH